MKEFKFEPKLVCRDQQKIDEEKTRWSEVIDSLNRFIVKWNKFFETQIDLPELWYAISQVDFKTHIKHKYVISQPQHAEFIQSKNVKIDEYLQLINIPDFSELIKTHKEAKEAIKNWVFRGIPNWNYETVDFKEFETFAPNIFINGQFQLTAKLEEYLIHKHSIFTTNIQQNYALFLVQQFCDNINTLINLGLHINQTDIPIIMRNCVEGFSIEKKYSELHYRCGEPNYNTINFKPSTGLTKNNNILYYINNLTQEQITEILKTNNYE